MLNSIKPERLWAEIMDKLKDKNSFDDAAQNLCGRIKDILDYIPASAKEKISEIRLREDKPLMVQAGSTSLFVTGQSRLLTDWDGTCFTVSKKDIFDSVRIICGYSVHSHQHEIKEGFISVKGGHRAGISGTAVMENDVLINVRDINSINLRIARDIKGCANDITAAVFKNSLCGVIIAGAPSSGKTTLLRDIARQLCSGRLGRYYKVSIVDERREIGGVFGGTVQNELGICADILTGYKKSDGMISAIRALSPDVIICDEIGKLEEIAAVEAGLNSGVYVITTIHASTADEILSRPQALRLIRTGAFKKLILLEGANTPCKIKNIIDIGELNDKINGTCNDNNILQLNRNDYVLEAVPKG